jgi:hypothetical protein
MIQQGGKIISLIFIVKDLKFVVIVSIHIMMDMELAGRHLLVVDKQDGRV